jgi:hypothetical protein
MAKLTAFEQYQRNLEKILTMKDSENVADEDNGVAQFPAQSDIELKQQLIHPQSPDNGDILTRDIRTANLDKAEYIKIVKGSLFLSYLNSFTRDHKLEGDISISELQDEVRADVGLFENASVAKGGKLLDWLLNPKKKFSVFTERQQGKNIFGKKEENG